MGEGNAFPFNDVHAHGSGIQQDVHHVVIEQVNFVDIQQTAVGSRQNTRLKTAHTLLDGFLDIQGAHHAVLGSGNRQVHEWCGFGYRHQFFTFFSAFTALGAPGGRFVGIAPKPAVVHHFHVGQQGRQCPGSRGFGRAAFPADEHTPDARINGV